MFTSRNGNVPIAQRDCEETFDHRVELLWHFELAEVAGAHGLAVHEPGTSSWKRLMSVRGCGSFAAMYRAATVQPSATAVA